MKETIDFGEYNGLQWNKLSTEYLHGLSDMGNENAKEQLNKIYSLPIEQQRVGFGKFSGLHWIELNVDYLYWIMNNIDAKNIKVSLAKKALKYKEESIQLDDFEEVIYVD